MKYRSMNEIFESILCSIAINDGLGFKKIMYSCYLSYAQVTRFLQFAKENDFLVHDNNMGLFKIKDKKKKKVSHYDNSTEEQEQEAEEYEEEEVPYVK